MKKLLLLLLVLSSSLLTYSQGLWTQRASLPDSARSFGVSFSIGNYGYAGLGMDSKSLNYFNDFWQFNPATNSWTRKADFPGRARVAIATFVIGKYAYIISGSEQNDVGYYVNDVWKYNSSTNTWTQKTSFPGIARFGAIGFAIGGNGYVVGGLDTLPPTFGCYTMLRDVWKYDTASDNWVKKNNFPGPLRYCGSGFSVNGYGYISMGMDSNCIGLNDIWQYNDTSDTWKQKSSNPKDSLGFTSGFSINNNIYIGIGSETGYIGYPSTFWLYNTLNDTWTQQANYPLSKDSIFICSGFAISDTGYIGFGEIVSNFCTCDSPSSQLFRFYPDTLTGIANTKNTKIPEIAIYPNPCMDRCYVSISKGCSSVDPLFALIDMGGRIIKVLPERASGNTFSIKVKGLTEGMYFLKIETIKETYFRKIVIYRN